MTFRRLFLNRRTASLSRLSATFLLLTLPQSLYSIRYSHYSTIPRGHGLSLLPLLLKVPFKPKSTIDIWSCCQQPYFTVDDMRRRPPTAFRSGCTKCVHIRHIGDVVQRGGNSRGAGNGGRGGVGRMHRSPQRLPPLAGLAATAKGGVGGLSVVGGATGGGASFGGRGGWNGVL